MDKIIPFGLILVFKVVEGPINLPAIIGQFVNGGKLSQSFKELHFLYLEFRLRIPKPITENLF